MVNCSNCGFDVGESKFCPNCGHEVKSFDEVNICSNCGADVGESNFCPQCGTKVVVEENNVICSKCGTDIGNSNFCPNCGQPAQKSESSSFCPSCGKEINLDSKFCPHCGFSESSDNTTGEKDFVDNIIDLDDKFSNKMGGLLGKSKTMNALLDKTSSIGYNRAIENPMGSNMKYYEKIEPVFLEVLESINDNLVIAILVHKRSMMGSGGGVIGTVASQVYTPTKGMSHDEAVKYYRDMANEIFAEINNEKRKGTFDGEEFYKKKVKEHSLDNSSFFGLSKSIKAYRKNQK